MKKHLFLACALAFGMSACSQHQEQPAESGSPVKTTISPVTAPGKKPDRPAVKLPPKSVPVPSVSPSYNNTPLSPRIPGVTVNRVAVPDKVVALTFDDGPRRGTTARLLDGLRERGASATFFLVGERLAGNEDLVLRMQAEGHQVGTHTWSHIRLDGTAPAAQLRDIQAAQNAVCKLLDTDSCWLRPPYGLIDPAVRGGVTVPMVHWSVDPRDWESRDTAMVVRSVLKDVQPGDIILLHDIYPSSVEAALQIVDALEAEGYWFVTVEELLELNGIQPQAGAMYRSGRV